MKQYINVDISNIGEDDQEIVLAMLEDFPTYEAIWQDEDSMMISYSQDQMSKSQIEDMMKNMKIDFPYKIQIQEDKNWNEVFESSFHPIVLKDNSWGVRASFHPSMKTTNEIIIDPKMSFGTGHHETTRLMMQQMTQLDFRDKSVWDYGSGTGILAIMAAKMGATYILANDHEEWAYKNAIENCEINQTQNIQVVYGTISDAREALNQKKFDIVIANITKNILIDSALDINTYSHSETKLLLSGFYEEDVPELTEVYSQYGFIFKNSLAENSWASILLEKNQ